MGRRFRIHPRVPLDDVPEALRSRVGPDAPAPARSMAAKALLPVDPADLVILLSYLATQEEAEDLARDAEGSLRNAPDNIILPSLSLSLPPDTLAYCATVFLEDSVKIEAIILNAATPDDAIAFVASQGRGRVLEMISVNQVRLLRSAEIVEALYFNAATPTVVASRVVETAVRGGLDISSIPGYREIAASILGETVVSPEAPDDEPLNIAEIATAETSDPVPAEGGIDESTFQALAMMDEGQELTEAVFDQLLRVASGSEEDTGTSLEETASRESNALWRLIRDMSVPQKVRLALMGNTTARSLLVRDSKKVVAMAVLRSPGLSEKEIAGFAQNKALPDDVIRRIAYTREWTKSYVVRLSLITNPKTPPNRAASFISTLRDKDIRRLAKNKDVPSYVARQAKTLMGQRERHKR